MPVKKSGMPVEGREGVTTYTITYNGANSVISREVKMDVSGINIGGCESRSNNYPCCHRDIGWHFQHNLLDGCRLACPDGA